MGTHASRRHAPSRVGRAAWITARAPAIIRRHWVVLLGLVAVGGLLVAVDPARVVTALRHADPRALAAMLPCVLLLYTLHGVAWRYALRGVGAAVTAGEAIRVTWISQAFVYLPGGDLWRVPIVRGGDGATLSRGDVTATVVFDDLVYFLVLTSAMLPAVAARPRLVVPLGIALTPQAAIFVVLLSPRPYGWLARRAGRLPVVRRFRGELESLGPAFRRLCTPRTLAPVVVLDVACATLAVTLFWLSLDAVHAGATPADAAFAYAVGNVASGLTVLPGALGAYEGMMTGLMAVQGVAPAVAAAAALLYRAYNDALMALLGLGLALAATPAGRATSLSRRVAALPWAVLRVGRAGNGRAVGVPWFWAAWERLMLRVHPLTPVAADAVLRYRVVRHRGATVRLRDGTTVRAGDRLVELHLDNSRFADARRASGYGAWSALGRLRADVAGLARLVASGALGDVVAVHGVSLLGAAGERLGFEVRPLPHTLGTAFERYFMAGLDAIYHREGLARLRRPRHRWPVETWVSAEALRRRARAAPR